MAQTSLTAYLKTWNQCKIERSSKDSWENSYLKIICLDYFLYSGLDVEMHCSINFAGYKYFTEENIKVTVVHYDSEIRIMNEPVCCLQQFPSSDNV